MSLTIRKATKDDITSIESILFDVTDHFEKIGDVQWLKKDVTWEGLSVYFTIEDFYIAFKDSTPVGCMVILDHDPRYWPEIPKGASLYIHKLAVRRAYAGKGYSKMMVDCVKDMAREKNIGAIHLDCHASKIKLRKLYEDQGFVFIKEDNPEEGYHAAYYEWTNCEASE